VEYRSLGKTGINVSRLCFGTLTIGPLQAGLSIKKGAYLIREACEEGINFFDTAETYKNYQQLYEAFKGIHPKPVVATKSYAYKKEDMELSLISALKNMGLEVIDIFLLHEQESELTIKGHYPALEYLLRAKQKGYIRAVGISCHTVAAVKGALKFPEIDIIHPMINIKGIGIKDGTLEEMLEALEMVEQNKTGIYGMKPLGGGHLIGSYKEALNFALSLEFLDSIAVGIQSKGELIINKAIFSGEPVPEDYKEKVNTKPRKLVIGSWCEGCGKCVSNCPQNALQLKDSRVSVIEKECTLCGYCGAYCMEMCLKIF